MQDGAMQDDGQPRADQPDSESGESSTEAQIGNAKVKRPEKLSDRSVPDDRLE
jgi:hypothetical protein